MIHISGSGRISIHAPCVGSDPGRVGYGGRCRNFNPRSLCGERPLQMGETGNIMNFNPRSLCGERLVEIVNGIDKIQISIHAPCVGSDRASPVLSLSTGISIHAPCVGSDIYMISPYTAPTYFNPRSLCGERPRLRYQSASGALISIHAPCVGSDPHPGAPQ